MTNDDHGKDSTGAAGVKLDVLVRGLDWSLPIPKQNSTEHLTTCGRYKVVEWFDKSGHVLSFHRFGKPLRIEAETRVCGADVLKAAAQADYTARILAAIDADAIAALVGALREYMEHDADYCRINQLGDHAQSHRYKRAFAALARLGGGEPMRCAECDCAGGGTDCNWIKSEGKK